MKPTPKPTQYDCIFFTLSQSLFEPTATAQDTHKHHTPTEDGGHHYVVEQVDRVADGDASEATLTCVDMAHGSKIRIRVLGIATAQRGTSSQKNPYLVPVNKLTFYPWREHGHCGYDSEEGENSGPADIVE